MHMCLIILSNCVIQGGLLSNDLSTSDLPKTCQPSMLSETSFTYQMHENTSLSFTNRDLVSKGTFFTKRQDKII